MWKENIYENWIIINTFTTLLTIVLNKKVYICVYGILKTTVISTRALTREIYVSSKTKDCENKSQLRPMYHLVFVHIFLFNQPKTKMPETSLYAQTLFKNFYVQLHSLKLDSQIK